MVPTRLAPSLPVLVAVLSLGLLLAAGCSDGPGTDGRAGGGTGGGSTGGTGGGGGGGMVMDAGPPDAGPPDAGPPDAGPPDAGPPDAGPPDAGPPDAGPPDAGPPDAGPPDAGRPDAGPPDAGPPDAGPPDSGSPDAGTHLSGRLLIYEACEVEPLYTATVTLLQSDGGARTALSDGTGLFRFRDVAPGRYQLRATPSVTYGPAYSGTSQLAVEVASGLETQVTMYLPTLCSGLATLPADASVTVQTSCSAGFSTVTLSPGDLRRPDGGVFSGSLRLRASYPPNNLLLPDGGPDRGAYMTLVGTSWGRTAADAGVFLSSRASATLALFDQTSDEPLSVSSGRSVRVQLGLATRMDAGLVDGGSTIGAYRYRPASGEWFEETTASYVDTFGVRTYDLQTTTLGAWTAATAATSSSCVAGRVEWADAGVPGADVWAYAIDRAQAARTNAASGGTFCLDLEADVPLYLLGRTVVPGLPAVFDPQGFLEMRSGTGGSCAAARSSCADAGVLVLTEPPGACISGVARDTSSPPADGGSPPAYQSPFVLASEPPRRTRRQASCSSGDQPMQYVDPGSSGAFCTAIIPGSTTIQAIDPLGTCSGETRNLDAGAGGSCGGSGCTDLGDLEFFCGGS